MNSTEPTGIKRAIMGIVGAQVAIAAALLVIDLSAAMPKIDPITRQYPSGPSTQPYSPKRAPMVSPDGVPRNAPMPERLEMSSSEGVMTLTGQIAVGDGARISSELALRERAGEEIEVISLNSTGGSVSDALELGDAIRLRGLATDLADGAICLSACPYIFAGGVTRTADPTAKLGVHQHYFGESSILPAFMAVEDVQRGQAEVMAHLARMGIELGVMEHAMRTPPEEIYILSRDEMTDYAFLTEDD